MQDYSATLQIKIPPQLYALLLLMLGACAGRQINYSELIVLATS